MNNQNPYIFPGPAFPGPNFPGGNNNWNQNSCNCREQINRLDNRISRLERQVRRLDQRVTRLENGLIMPLSSDNLGQNDNYGNNGMYMI